MSEKKDFDLKADCLRGEDVTVERLAELAANDSGKCGRVARGMLETLFGKETAGEVMREYGKRGAGTEGRGEQ